VGELLQVGKIELEEDELEFKADVEARAADGTLTPSFAAADGTADTAEIEDQSPIT